MILNCYQLTAEEERRVWYVFIIILCVLSLWESSSISNWRKTWSHILTWITASVSIPLNSRYTAQFVPSVAWNVFGVSVKSTYFWPQSQQLKQDLHINFLIDQIDTKRFVCGLSWLPFTYYYFLYLTWWYQLYKSSSQCFMLCVLSSPNESLLNIFFTDTQVFWRSPHVAAV